MECKYSPLCDTDVRAYNAYVAGVSFATLARVWASGQRVSLDVLEELGQVVAAAGGGGRAGDRGFTVEGALRSFVRSDGVGVGAGTPAAREWCVERGEQGGESCVLGAERGVGGSSGVAVDVQSVGDVDNAGSGEGLAAFLVVSGDAGGSRERGTAVVSDESRLECAGQDGDVKEVVSHVGAVSASGRGRWWHHNREKKRRKKMLRQVERVGEVPAWRVGAGPQNAGCQQGRGAGGARFDAVANVARMVDATDDPKKKVELANTWIDRKIEENVKAAARARADVARMKKDEADGVYDRKREVEIAILDKQLSGELSLVIPRSFKKWAQDAAAVARSVSDSSGSKAKSAGSKIKTVTSGSVGVNSSVSKNASLTDAATMESVVELMDENLALKREIDALKSATERGKVFASMRAENERLKRENRKLEEGTKILMEQDIQAYNDFCAPMGYDTDDGW